MHWYLVHTKPRQEHRALLNLEQQGYICYLPVMHAEKLQNGSIIQAREPLFARYLFIQLDTESSGKGWAPIRSTKGVSRLVTFGTEPGRIDDKLIQSLKRAERAGAKPAPLFAVGEYVTIVNGPFTGIEAVYAMRDGESRAMVLIQLLSRTVSLQVPVVNLRKAQ